MFYFSLLSSKSKAPKKQTLYKIKLSQSLCICFFSSCLSPQGHKSWPIQIQSRHHHASITSRGKRAAAAKSLQLCPTLCDPIDSSPPGFAVPGILQARTLEWIAISFSKVKSKSEVAQSCPTLSDPMDCSLPGSSVHGIFQARVLEWGAIAFSSCAAGHVIFTRIQAL